MCTDAAGLLRHLDDPAVHSNELHAPLDIIDCDFATVGQRQHRARKKAQQLGCAVPARRDVVGVLASRAGQGARKAEVALGRGREDSREKKGRDVSLSREHEANLCSWATGAGCERCLRCNGCD
jgi:hypothetical protein